MIEFKNIAKTYGDKEVIHEISLTIPKGEIVTLIGASGCGKTTMLKMINRLIPLTSGDIFVNGKSISEFPPVELRKQIGYVIQQVGLFPHMTIRENLGTVLNLHQVPRGEQEEKIRQIMVRVGLDVDLLDRYPIELSGGQQQRVGVARALVTDPEVILMDEPFSAIDPITRATLQDELRLLQESLQKTIVFVTHDMNEAIKISDRICLMRDGRIEQYDTPEVVLRNPATPFVEQFVGKNRIWSSPEYIKAEDIMTEPDNLCYPADSLVRCIRKIKDTPQDFLIMVDPATGVFKGLVTAKMIREQDSLRQYARDIAQPPVAVAKMNDSLPDVLTTVKRLHRPYMVVLDEQERPVGIITQSSLVATLGRQYVDEEVV